MNHPRKNPSGVRDRAGGKQEQRKSLPNYNKTEIEINSVLFYDPDVEIKSLHACLSDPTATDRAREYIVSADYYCDGGKMIFQTLCDFRDSGRDYTPSLILAAFENSSEYDHVENFISGIGPFFTGQTSRHFAKIVLEQSLRRSLIRATFEAHSKCCDQSIAIPEILSELEAAIHNVRRRLVNE